MTLKRKIGAMIRLIRPELPIAAGVCVVVGQVIALGQLPPLPRVLLGFALGFFFSSSAMIFNDVFDLDVDRINMPTRPLPAGLLSLREAAALGAATAIVGLAIALAIHPIAFGLSLITWILGFLYNWKLKAAGLWGNLIVSTNVGMTIILGGISVGQALNPMLWTFALIAFVFDLAEEIAGDAMDISGDELRASRSIAIVYGKRAALRVSAGLFAVMIALSYVPVLWGETRAGYLVPMTMTDLVIVFFMVRLLKSATPQAGRSAMRGLYLSASVGLVAFIFSRFIR